jgi:hypothetical protein
MFFSLLAANSMISCADGGETVGFEEDGAFLNSRINVGNTLYEEGLVDVRHSHFLSEEEFCGR